MDFDFCNSQGSFLLLRLRRCFKTSLSLPRRVTGKSSSSATCRYLLRQRNHRHPESTQSEIFTGKLRRSRRLLSGGWVHVFLHAARGSWKVNLKIAIPLVDQEELMFSVLGDKALDIDIRDAGAAFDQLIAGTEIVMQQFQSPEAGIGLARFPVHHGDAGKLRGIPYELRFAHDLNAEVCQVAVKVCVHR